MTKIPQIKKKIQAFLVKEEGKISKESLLKTGIFLSIISLSALKAQAACSVDNTSHNQHCNNLGVSYSAPTITGTHEHAHGNHTSY